MPILKGFPPSTGVTAWGFVSKPKAVEPKKMLVADMLAAARKPEAVEPDAFEPALPAGAAEAVIRTADSLAKARDNRAKPLTRYGKKLIEVKTLTREAIVKMLREAFIAGYESPFDLIDSEIATILDNHFPKDRTLTDVACRNNDTPEECANCGSGNVIAYCRDCAHRFNYRPVKS